MARNKSRVIIKGVTEVTNKIKKVIKTAISRQQLLNKIGSTTVERIVFQARTGKSLSTGKAVKFSNLGDFTKALRRAISDTEPSLIQSRVFKPGFSNVSLTGQLLESVGYEIKGNKISIIIDGSRSEFDYSALARKARSKFGSKDDRAKILGYAAAFLQDQQASTNAEAYEELVSIGFDFIGIDSQGLKLIKQHVLDQLRKDIAKNFK